MISGHIIALEQNRPDIIAREKEGDYVRFLYQWFLMCMVPSHQMS